MHSLEPFIRQTSPRLGIGIYVTFFLDDLYCIKVRHEVKDKPIWSPSKTNGF